MAVWQKMVCLSWLQRALKTERLVLSVQEVRLSAVCRVCIRSRGHFVEREEVDVAPPTTNSAAGQETACTQCVSVECVCVCVC